MAGPAAARGPVALGVASENSRSMAEVNAFIDRTGVKPRLWTLWSTWGDRGGKKRCARGVGTCAFPSRMATRLATRGITPIIWWQPSGPGDKPAGHYGSYRRIANGTHDAYIRRWAKAARRFGEPVIVRLAHEMNGNWFDWSVTNHGNSPDGFRQAWRRVVGLFRSVGATNVKFLWCPYPRGWAGFRQMYPGDAWVDYVGVTALNWAHAEGWKSLPLLLEGPMAKLREATRTPGRPLGKPVILPEVGTNFVGGNKATWIRHGFERAYRKWPQLRAIVYFDYDTTFAGQVDWRLEQPADGSALEAYREVASQQRFRARFR